MIVILTLVLMMSRLTRKGGEKGRNDSSNTHYLGTRRIAHNFPSQHLGDGRLKLQRKQYKTWQIIDEIIAYLTGVQQKQKLLSGGPEAVRKLIASLSHVHLEMTATAATTKRAADTARKKGNEE